MSVNENQSISEVSSLKRKIRLTDDIGIDRTAKVLICEIIAQERNLMLCSSLVENNRCVQAER